MKQRARQIAWPSWYELSLSHRVIEVLRDIEHKVEQEMRKGQDRSFAKRWIFRAGDNFLAEFHWERIGADTQVTVNTFIAERLRARYAVS
jgi:hypothetical protein